MKGCKKFALLNCIVGMLLAATCFLTSCFNEEIYPVGKRTIPEDYHPLVMEGKQWNYQADDTRTSKSCICSYRIQGDTLIGKTMYKKLLMQVSTQEDREQWMYVGALREMAMQVFYLRKDNHNEDLIYDFGVRKGNKLKWNGLKVEVSSIDQYLVSKGFHYRIIDLNGIDYCMCAYQWIEGIGNYGDCLFWREDFYAIHYLATCCEGDVCIFNISDMDFIA